MFLACSTRRRRAPAGATVDEPTSLVLSTPDDKRGRRARQRAGSRYPGGIETSVFDMSEAAGAGMLLSNSLCSVKLEEEENGESRENLNGRNYRRMRLSVYILYIYIIYIIYSIYSIHPSRLLVRHYDKTLKLPDEINQTKPHRADSIHGALRRIAAACGRQHTSSLPLITINVSRSVFDAALSRYASPLPAWFSKHPSTRLSVRVSVKAIYE